ncbi:MAG TPA: Mut7-C RNAse domain-containing protein [Nitrososphaeraceae archaeon]|nr:Mut7-C RNAse domain-containing protein [Nitrososphaeraceae archaeon]
MERNNEFSFLADAMLGKIARKLRIFGFDTVYDSHLADENILNSPIYIGRIVLTSDKELFNRCKKKQIDTILTYKDTEIENLVTIFRTLNIKYINLPTAPYLCTSCNGKVDRISDNSLINNKLSDQLLQTHKIFYKCTKCRKIYWEGSHMKRISRLVNEINAKLTA